METPKVFCGEFFWCDQFVGVVGITVIEILPSDKKSQCWLLALKRYDRKGIAAHRVPEHAFFDVSLHHIEPKEVAEQYQKLAYRT